jgi:hypothetical protein
VPLSCHQITPYTVVLSKLGEAVNFAPPYIEDAVMTDRVSFKREVAEDGTVSTLRGGEVRRARERKRRGERRKEMKRRRQEVNEDEQAARQQKIGEIGWEKRMATIAEKTIREGA